MSDHTIAVLIPCYNEELSVAQVVRDFKKALPAATIYVYDNNSTDRTAELAREAGAVVRREFRQGKGNVVQRMFAEVEAEIYVLVDGDATYDATSCPAMIERLSSQKLAMVVGKRIHQEKAAYRTGHVAGNRLFTAVVRGIFGNSFSDLLSGYRVLSRSFVKSYPCLSRGFEVETDMTVHALQLNLPVGEVDTVYQARSENSYSKLNTYRDGFKILYKLLSLFLYERPKLFFGLISGILLSVSLILAFPLIATWFSTGLVPRLPTAILCSSLVILAGFSLSMGLIIAAVQKNRKTSNYLAYLSEMTHRKSGGAE